MCEKSAPTSTCPSASAPDKSKKYFWSSGICAACDAIDNCDSCDVMKDSCYKCKDGFVIKKVDGKNTCVAKSVRRALLQDLGVTSLFDDFLK